jgi:hypothetical protein
MVSVKPKMESPNSPDLQVRIVEESENGLLCMVSLHGEDLGEVDIDIISNESGFISAEALDKGYLRPASLAIAAFLRERDRPVKELYDIEDQLIT